MLSTHTSLFVKPCSRRMGAKTACFKIPQRLNQNKRGAKELPTTILPTTYSQCSLMSDTMRGFWSLTSQCIRGVPQHAMSTHVYIRKWRGKQAERLPLSQVVSPRCIAVPRLGEVWGISPWCFLHHEPPGWLVWSHINAGVHNSVIRQQFQNSTSL